VIARTNSLSPDTSLRGAINRFHSGRPDYPIVNKGGRLEGYCGGGELFEALRGHSHSRRGSVASCRSRFLQSEIARDVPDKLRVKLSGADEQKLSKKYTTA
jgi:hypothetical protein